MSPPRRAPASAAGPAPAAPGSARRPSWPPRHQRRLLALKLNRYQNATPEKIWRHFLDATGTLHINDQGVTCALNLR
ncbi:MAG: hypothetical protein ACRDOK_21365, partial [Streptosporangiaceae bacterium]